jgi:DNA-binding Lrp family transcriptional regulator
MLKDKDLLFINHLRGNARKKITELSRELDIPVTTLYDKLHIHKKRGIIQKHITLLDFAKLGYYARAVLSIDIDLRNQERLREYLLQNNHVNSMYRVDCEETFIAEVVFENPYTLQEFIEQTKLEFTTCKIKANNILQEIKKESFMASPNRIETSAKSSIIARGEPDGKSQMQGMQFKAVHDKA